MKAPRTPIPKLYSPFALAAVAGMAMRGAAAIGGGAGTAGAAAALKLKEGLASTGAGAGAAGIWPRIVFAAAVPSTPHEGQATANGIWFPTGVTSNL